MTTIELADEQRQALQSAKSEPIDVVLTDVVENIPDEFQLFEVIAAIK